MWMSYPVQIFRLCIYWKGSLVLVSQLKGRLKIENWFINKPMDYWIIGLINQWLSYSPTLLTGTIADRNALDLADDSTSRNAQMPQPDTGWTFRNAGRHVPVWKIDQQLNNYRTDEVCINLYWGVLWLDCLWPRGIACFGASVQISCFWKLHFSLQSSSRTEMIPTFPNVKEGCFSLFPELCLWFLRMESI